MATTIDYRITARWRTRTVTHASGDTRLIVYVEFRLDERTSRVVRGAAAPITARTAIVQSHLLPWQADRFVAVLRAGVKAGPSGLTLEEEGSYFTRPAPNPTTTVTPSSGAAPDEL